MTDHHGLHGIGPKRAELVLEQLGIAEHTDEDCLVSSILYNVTSKPIVAHGSDVFVEVDGQWTRYKMAAGARRRMLAGNPGELTLEAP